MKHTRKLLLATTALAVTAGAAAAGDIDISGSAEMGVTGGSGGTETQFHQDVDVTFKMSGETDGGLTFGTAIDLDEMDSDTTDDEGIEVYISGAFGRLGLGDTDGALDWAVSEVPAGPGSIADNQEHGAWYGSHLDGMYDGQILRYDHTVPMGAGTVGFAASLEMDDTPEMALCYDEGMSGMLDADVVGTEFDETDTHCITANNESESQLGTEPSDNVIAFGVKFDMPLAGDSKMNFGVGYQGGGSVHAWDLGKRRNEGVTVAAANLQRTDSNAVTETENVLFMADPTEIMLKTTDKSEVGVSVGFKTGGFSVGLRASQISNAAAKYVDPETSTSEVLNINSAGAGEGVLDGIDSGDDILENAVEGLEGNSIKLVTTPGGVKFSDARHLAVGASYKVDAFTIGVNYGTMDYDNESVANTVKGTGLSLGYKLGDGASALFGYGRTDEDTMEAKSTWSAGLSFSF